MVKEVFRGEGFGVIYVSSVSKIYWSYYVAHDFMLVLDLMTVRVTQFVHDLSDGAWDGRGFPP